MISVESLVADAEAGPAQQDRPALAAQREAEVEDDERASSTSTGLAARIRPGHLGELLRR